MRLLICRPTLPRCNRRQELLLRGRQPRIQLAADASKAQAAPRADLQVRRLLQHITVLAALRCIMSMSTQKTWMSRSFWRLAKTAAPFCFTAACTYFSPAPPLIDPGLHELHKNNARACRSVQQNMYAGVHHQPSCCALLQPSTQW